ncbi:MAG: fumarylacetoacetate hydrolase family protein, partial [Alphaproteobacteria bacterium]|nr:fumarylacetoacetate hydrolase family protein [Alphaproteobacteria bacterium]
GWPIGIRPTVADNGVHAAFVLGEEISDWHAIDRPGIAVSVAVNGETLTDGSGANALDDPVNALVWLANAATARGQRLAAGAVITTGNTANQAVFATPGDSAVARFSGLGEVRVDFA